jgi:hypothetical protein
LLVGEEDGMGMDFAALVRYYRKPDVVREIARLENEPSPLCQEVLDLLEGTGYYEAPARSCWVSHGWSIRQMKRPTGPSLKVSLRTVDGFFLTFGQGVFAVTASVRWIYFLQNQRWQAALLRACDEIATRLKAPEGVVLSDFHPAYQSFSTGRKWHECFRALPPAEGEVATIADLYEVVRPDGTWDSHGYWRFRRDGVAVVDGYGSARIRSD